MVTLTLPRAVVDGVTTLPPAVLDRLHHLLERNCDDSLSAVELAELETLVKMSHFSQIVSLALQTPARQ